MARRLRSARLGERRVQVAIPATTDDPERTLVAMFMALNPLGDLAIGAIWTTAVKSRSVGLWLVATSINPHAISFRDYDVRCNRARIKGGNQASADRPNVWGLAF